MAKQIIVLATRNKGKVEEIRALLAGYPVIIKDLSEFGPIPEVVEDGKTFDDNAYKKSSHTARVLGFPAMADDSGLVVEALDGQPGVHSARFGGPGKTDADRCALLLEKMEGREDRRAAFECVVSIAMPTGPALTYEGRVEGEITRQPHGESGFGYDPVFYYPPAGKTFAELSREEKNQVSHRGRALSEVAAEMDKILQWVEMHLPEHRCLGEDLPGD